MSNSNRRPLCLIAAGLNISLYLYFFFNELPRSFVNGGRNLTVNSTNPLEIVVPQSIAQSKIKVRVWKDFCPRPIVRLRLVGPEIRVFPLFAPHLDDSSVNVHTLEVDIRKSSMLVGTYKVEANVMRCLDEGIPMATSFRNINFSCSAESEWTNIFNIGSYDSNSSNWMWVNSPKCTSQPGVDGGQRSPECADSDRYGNQADYVFMEINKETKNPLYNNLVTLKDGRTALSTPTSLTASDESSSLLKYFAELSNYELVCWLGDDDAQRYWRAFLDLYPRVESGGQRPFKFKFIKLTDTSDPTKDFSDATHMTYDKCKIFFVSYGIDRFDAGISHESFSKEVEILLGHIEKSHPDITYPTWFLSPRSDSSIPDKVNSCLETGGFRGRTPDRIEQIHQRMHRIFRDRRLAAPQSEPRIHLMDNSDITEAFWHIPSSKEDVSSNMREMETQITAAVAMRCMEKIAQQVKAWRSINQIGTQNGLMKNGKLIPNSELFKHPYTWAT